MPVNFFHENFIFIKLSMEEGFKPSARNFSWHKVLLTVEFPCEFLTLDTCEPKREKGLAALSSFKQLAWSI